MPIMILQLSDIHINADISCLTNRTSQLIEEVSEIVRDAKHCFIVLSGDVAFSGEESQYNLALSYTETLSHQIKEKFPTLHIEFIVVPGNHDCNFGHDSQARKILLDTLVTSNRELDEGIIDICTTTQESYFDFAEIVTSTDIPRGLSRIFHRHQFDLDGHLLVFNCYNTAWLSKKREVQGELKYPTDFLLQQESFDTKYDCVISVFHHSYNWMEANNARHLKKHIEKTSDIIITGHEHTQHQLVQETIFGDINEYIAGGVLSCSYSTESSFNVVLLDIPSRRQKIIFYQWSDDSYIVAKQKDWFPFARSVDRERNQFQNHETFRNYLSDPGVHYSHPRKGQLNLQDFFIYPSLLEIDPTRTPLDKKERTIKSDLTFDYLYDKKNVIIIGDNYSGKTTLAKVLYVRLQHLGEIPILLKGKAITSDNNAKLEKLLKKTFTSQYSPDLYLKYSKLRPHQKALLIDDFHLSSLNVKKKNAIIEYLSQTYGRIIIFGNELLQIEEISSPESLAVLRYTHCGIREWGHVLKEKLVTKWISLGRKHETTNSEELALAVRNAEHRVYTILGKNLLPSYPWIILAILQSLEANVNLNTVLGTYGYFYQMLITESLSKSFEKSETVDLTFNYLSELAYFLFSNHLTEFSHEQITKIDTDYFDKYKVKTPPDILLELIRANIVQEIAEKYRFRYDYIYYFFVARYMAERLYEEKIRKKIESLCSEVYKEDYANIVIFLSYHSKDPFIIGTIITKAESVFKNVKPCDFSEDVTFLNESCGASPKIVIPANTYKEKLLQTKDDLEELEKEIPQEENAPKRTSETEKAYQELLQFNIAFKNLQIMGQTLRNFAGSLPGDTKINLTKACYNLGLRTLKSLLSILEANYPQIKDVLTYYCIEELKIKNDNRLDDKIRHFLYYFTEAITFNTIKKITHAVGAEQLEEIYKIIVTEADTIANHLVDVSIKLDHFAEIPEKQIYNLNEKLKKNPFSLTLLHFFVAHYLYLFPCKREIRHRLCSKLGFKQEDPSMFGSSTKKFRRL